jgi:hypothetical protein
MARYMGKVVSTGRASEAGRRVWPVFGRTARRQPAWHNAKRSPNPDSRLPGEPMPRAHRWPAAALALVVCLALAVQPTLAQGPRTNALVPPSAPADSLMLGFSTRDFDNLYYWNTSLTMSQRVHRAIDDVKKAGAGWWRPHILWSKVEPNLLYPALTRAQVTSALVDTYAARTDWHLYDDLVAYANSQGVQLVFVLAAGYVAPFNQMPMYNGRPVTPRSDVSIGSDAYIANAYLHARATVRRYKGSMHWWQLENELNVAGWQTQFPVGAGYTWRDGAEWWSGTFCQQLLAALRDAVKAEDPGATITLNFHQLNKDAINAWAPLLDVVGYDYYPSNIATEDVYTELVDVQQRAGAGKPLRRSTRTASIWAWWRTPTLTSGATTCCKTCMPRLTRT